MQINEEILRMAILGHHAAIRRLEIQLEKLLLDKRPAAGWFTATPAETGNSGRPATLHARGKRTLSAAGRAAISAAAKRRWAKQRQTKKGA